MMGWPLTLFGLVGLVVLGTLLPATLLLVFWQIWTQSQKRRNESLEVTDDGLTWKRAGQESFFVAWPELQELHIESRGFIGLPFYRIETARGELSWNNGLNGWAQFRRTLRERAPQLQETTAPRLENALFKAPENKAETETLTFHFKTRELRAMLFLIASVALTCLGFAIFGPPSGQREPASPWVFALTFLLGSAATCYLFLLFQRGSIELNKRGIEWKVPLRTRFVAWSEVQEIGVGRDAFLRVGGKKLPIYSVQFPTAHHEILLQEIASRTKSAKDERQTDEKTAST
ncbi:hypothetical protein B1R32_11072 [Abditibacterium utsteinense]|uniref:PH domain-containing protein n=1 Tax=Abditibacterium utsteinense TaxID=1960156 RepID=A0A2S8SS54_9BACT|nr:hypothetical protein [Abditibacterium utsteinense]PQV63606.1 hypothetical protein B1R32_11072 [Abditibacterium utsteinense]